MRHNVINLDECKSTETYWITLYGNSNNKNGSYNTPYFKNFGVERIPKKSKIHRKRSMITNIYRIQACDSIVWEYFFNDFMSKSKSLLDLKNYFLLTNTKRVIK